MTGKMAHIRGWQFIELWNNLMGYATILGVLNNIHTLKYT